MRSRLPLPYVWGNTLTPPPRGASDVDDATRLKADPTQWPRDALAVTTSLNTNQFFLCNACDDQPSSVLRLGYGTLVYIDERAIHQ